MQKWNVSPYIVEYSDGAKYWFVGGQLHRDDGPAVEYEDNDYCEFWWQGKFLTFDAYIPNVSDPSVKTMLLLKYGGNLNYNGFFEAKPLTKNQNSGKLRTYQGAKR